MLHFMSSHSRQLKPSTKLVHISFPFSLFFFNQVLRGWEVPNVMGTGECFFNPTWKLHSSNRARQASGQASWSLSVKVSFGSAPTPSTERLQRGKLQILPLPGNQTKLTLPILYQYVTSDAISRPASLLSFARFEQFWKGPRPGRYLMYGR